MISSEKKKKEKEKWHVYENIHRSQSAGQMSDDSDEDGTFSPLSDCSDEIKWGS